MACMAVRGCGNPGENLRMPLIIDAGAEEPAGRPGMEPTVRLELTTC
jgi:hypothetical protein